MVEVRLWRKHLKIPILQKLYSCKCVKFRIYKFKAFNIAFICQQAVLAADKSITKWFLMCDCRKTMVNFVWWILWSKPVLGRKHMKMPILQRLCSCECFNRTFKFNHLNVAFTCLQKVSKIEESIAKRFLMCEAEKF